MKTTTITEQIERKTFQFLEEKPEGIRWSQLSTMIEKSDSNLHPKTINGILWKLPQKYPDRISKKNGLFTLIK